ncbi:MAG: TonB family protein [bacterium]
MITDQKRIQHSTSISLTLHGAVLGLYFFLKMTQTQNEIVLARVEFLEMRQPAPVQALPAQHEPKNIFEFLKMALPAFKPSQPQESQPQEIPRERLSRMQEMLSTPERLVDKGRPPEREQAIKLASAELPRSQEASFADIKAKLETSRIPESELAESRALNLEAVGRVAVREAAPAIRIDSGAQVVRPAKFAELNVPRPRVSATSQASFGVQETAMDLLKEAPAARRSAAVPSARLPMGYGKGSGGISLETRAIARPALPAQDVFKPAPAAAQEKALEPGGPKKKAVEISGPLAQRKVVSISLPDYPDWAKTRGVEAEVVIRFFVSPEGGVRDKLFLESTSGYKELDNSSMEALKKWIFAPLPKAGSEEADQWGIITFRFQLK